MGIQIFMIMSDKVRDFIEKNIQLINDGDFDKVIKKCPVNIRPGLFQAFQEAGIDFSSEKIEDGVWYSLQTAAYETVSWRGGVFHDTYKLVISSLDRKTNQYRWTYRKANGVVGGSWVAFKSLKDALDFAKKTNASDVAPYLLDKMNATRYQWQLVTLDGGYQAYITDKMVKEYDPDLRKQRRLKEKATPEIASIVKQWANDLGKKIDTTVLDEMNKNKNASHPIYSPITFYYSNSYGRGRVMSGLGYSVDIDEKEILDYLNSILDVDNIKYEDKDIIIEDSYIDQVEKDIYSKYGVKI